MSALVEGGFEYGLRLPDGRVQWRDDDDEVWTGDDHLWVGESADLHTFAEEHTDHAVVRRAIGEPVVIMRPAPPLPRTYGSVVRVTEEGRSVLYTLTDTDGVGWRECGHGQAWRTTSALAALPGREVLFVAPEA